MPALDCAKRNKSRFYLDDLILTFTSVFAVMIITIIIVVYVIVVVGVVGVVVVVDLKVDIYVKEF